MDDWRHTLLPAVIPAFLFAALIMKQPDLGTALVCLGVTAAILYAAGMRLRYFAAGLVPIVPVLAYMLMFVPWRLARMVVFFHPERDPQGIGFHINQSLIAVGTGGMTGVGLMEGKQKLFYLPEPHTDFIYAVIGRRAGTDRRGARSPRCFSSLPGADCGRHCARATLLAAILPWA